VIAYYYNETLPYYEISDPFLSPILGQKRVLKSRSTLKSRCSTVKTVQIPSQTIPVLAETDVLVVGSGPGRLSAAIASARAGVETMLVERYGCFGGNLTQVGVESIAWYRRPGTVALP